MSGSGGGGTNSVSITVTATDRELAAAVRSAIASMDSLKSKTEAANSSFRSAGSGATSLMNAMKAQGQASLNASQSIEKASTAAVGLMNQQRALGQAALQTSQSFNTNSTAAVGLMNQQRSLGQASLQASQSFNTTSTAATGLMQQQRALGEASLAAANTFNNGSTAATGLMQQQRALGQASLQAAQSFNTTSTAATGLMEAMRSKGEAALRAAQQTTQASTAAVGLMQQQRALGQSMLQTTANMRNTSSAATGLMQSMRQLAQSTMEANRTIQQLTPPATSLMQTQRQLAQSTMEASRSMVSASTPAIGLMNAMKQQAQATMSASTALTGHAAAAEKAGMATSGVTREIIVLGHEAMVGQFSRIPGSLVVLAEMMGNVGIKTMALVAAFGLAVMAAHKLYDWMIRIKEAREQVSFSGAFFNPQLDQAKLQGIVDKYRTLRHVSTDDAKEVVATFASMKGATIPLIQTLVDNTLRFADATGTELPQAARVLKDAFQSPTEQGIHFLKSINASTEAIERFNRVTGDNAPMERRRIMLEALEAGTRRVGETSRYQRERMTQAMNATQPMTGMFGIAAPLFEDSEQRRAAAVAWLAKQDEKMAATHREALATMGNDERTMFNESWFDRMQMGADELKAKIAATHTDYRTLRLAEATALEEYWRNVSEKADKGSRDQIRAHTQWLQVKEQLEAQSLRVDPNATWFDQQQARAQEIRTQVMGQARDYKTARQMEYKAVMEFWQEASKQAKAGSRDQLRAHEEYLRAKEQLDFANLRTSYQGGQAGFRAQVAALTAQQAANKDNFQLVMQLEDQKLDIIRKNAGEASAIYQNELRHKAELENQHRDSMVRTAQEGIIKQGQVDANALQAKIKYLNAEVQGLRISKLEALEVLQQFANQQRELELKMVDDQIASLSKGTAAYERAIQQRAVIVSRFAKIETDLTAQSTAANDKAIQADLNAFTKSFENIGSLGRQTTMSLIQGTMTWEQAQNRVASAILTDFLDLTTQVLTRWVITQIAMTQVSSIQNAIRKAQDAGGTGMGALIQGVLGRWLGLETAKTAITVAEQPTRIGAETAGQAAVEAAKTSALVAGKASSAALASSQITSAAAVAGANTYAATSAIPVVGPGLAPGAAAGAVAAVEAFQALVPLEVGAWDVPTNMPAFLHKGEMVVPANFASGLRQQLAPGASNNSRNNFNFAPVIHGGGAAGMTPNQLNGMLKKAGTEMWSYLWKVSRTGSQILPGRPA